MDKLKAHKNQVLSGKEVREILGDDCAYLLKFMSDVGRHNGMVYETGLNVDVETFDPSGESSECGLFIWHIFDSFYDACCYGQYARQVFLEDDMRIYIEDGKMKADKVVLGEKMDTQDLMTQMLEKTFISNPIKTNEMMMKAVKKYGYSIKYIDQKFRTIDIMIEAVKNEGDAISLIDPIFRTYDMMMEAVKSNGYAIEHIDQKDRTYDMMMEAVKNNGYAIEHIDQKDRSYDMMMEAVKSRGGAIEHIDQESRTPEIMLEVVKIDGNVICHTDPECRTFDIIHIPSRRFYHDIID